jgi:hypothetical protein
LQNASLRPTSGAGHGFVFEEANPDMLQPLVTLTQFDIILMLRDSGRGLAGCCVYKPHLLRARTIDRLLRDFRHVLEVMLAQPDRPISTIRLSRNQSRRHP